MNGHAVNCDQLPVEHTMTELLLGAIYLLASPPIRDNIDVMMNPAGGIADLEKGMSSLSCIQISTHIK